MNPRVLEINSRYMDLKAQIHKLFPDMAKHDLNWVMGKVLKDYRNIGDIPRHVNLLLHSRYIRQPVTIREFVTSGKYLNLPVGQSGVYPKIMEALELLFVGNYSEVVLAGSIGWGKSTFGTIACAYELYRLSCLRDPAATYGMKPGSNMTFVNISVDKRQAERVFFTDLYNLIKGSKYFNTVFKYDKSLKTEIRFPKNVHCYPVAASEEAALGVGVFCAFIDEVNYMDVIERSKRSTPGTKNIYDQAEAVFNKLRARMRSRMNLHGRLPGHIYASSSARYPDDFTERLIKHARIEAEKGEFHTLILNYALWETIPEGRISPKRFRVEVGNEGRRTRVLDGTEPDVDEARVIEVPEDYRRDFERDPDLSVRDMAGRSVLSIRPFISRRERIKKMFELGEQAGLKHPFTQSTVTLQQKDPAMERLLPEHLHWIDMPKRHSVTNAFVYQNGKQVTEKKLFPALYHAHVDLAKNGDAAGLAIVHNTGKVKISRFDPRLQKMMDEYKPLIRVDLILRIVHPVNGEIDIPAIRGILYQLNREYGMQFGKITFDTFGSQESVKTMHDEGFNTDILSVDLDTTPYETLRTAIYDERILCYHDPILERELGQLERGEKKVDHPATHNGSKDLADALCGAIYNAEESWRAGEQNGIFEFGEVQHAGQPSPQRQQTMEQIYSKVVAGVPLTGQDEDDIIFGELENI